jgi:hypothetical protein
LFVKNQDKVALKIATIRSLYFASELDRFYNKMRERDSHIFECAYAWEPTNYFESNNAIDIDSVVYFFVVFAHQPQFLPSLSLDPVLELQPELKQELKKLKDEIPEITNDKIREEEIPEDEEKEKKSHDFNDWIKINFAKWFKQVTKTTIKYCNIGHNWGFKEEEINQLHNYYNANKLLVDCLNSSCNLSPTIKAHIEETFLLPIDP